jgi:hypothetical protein
MKPRSLLFALAVFVPVLGIVVWWRSGFPAPAAPTVLSFRVGQSFEEVISASTYPVMKRSNLPIDDPSGDKSGTTWVTEPAVIIRFTDAKHGFTLPPTKFAALTFQHNTAAMLSTSPMLDNLPFDEAAALLENLQNQFKAGGWEPWTVDGSTWFDLTPEGKKRLYARMFEPGYMQTAILRIPKKYGMTFRLKCAEGCWNRKPPYKFLIDVGVSDDIEGREPGDPEVWEQSHPAHQAPPRPAKSGTPSSAS